MQVMHGVLLFGAATGLAMEMAIGHLVGAGQLRKANALLRRALLLGLLAALGLALLVALNGRWLLGWFTQDPLILTQGATLLWWTVGVECGRMFNLVIINALRAAGDVRFPLQAGLISMPLVLAGGSWFLGLHLGWGLAGLWAAYAADELLRGAMMAWRWRSRVWVGKARAVRRRQTQARH
jgi:Na+-driven multidrug efflux pump